MGEAGVRLGPDRQSTRNEARFEVAFHDPELLLDGSR